MSRIHTSKIRIIIACLAIIGISAIWYSGIHKHLTFDQVKEHAIWLHGQIKDHYVRSVVTYLSTFIVVVCCCIPGAALMSIIGGFLFGWIGVVYIVIAATTGATLFFFLVRYLIGSYIQQRYAAKLVNFNKRIKENGWFFLLFLRCIPLIPFFMVNTFASLTTINTITYIWTTAVGVIPTSLIFVYAGKQFGTITQLRDIFSAPVIIALLMLIVVMTVPVLLNRYRKIF